MPQEGTPRLRGHVRQADGAPVKGATLTLIDVAGQQAGRDRTRPDGSYDVPLAAPGAFTLIVTAGGREPEVCAVHVGAGPTDWDVTLAGSGCLTGTVRVTGPGTRVAGAAVTLLGPHGDVVAAGCTDDAGRYRLDAVAPGRYTLVLSATSCQPAAMPILVAADTVTTQDAELARQARLEGTARAADGAGVPDARIALLDREGNTVAVTTTGPDGSYAFDGLPNGDYTVIASGYPPAASSLRVGPCQPNFHDVRLSHPQD